MSEAFSVGSAGSTSDSNKPGTESRGSARLTSGAGAPDSRRYAAMGDAVTVPVARWIGERLAAIT